MNNLINNIEILNIDNDNWWYPSKTGNKRIMLCGTHPIGQTNGYSRVMYYISKYLGEKTDIDLTIYGFQKFIQSYTQTMIRNEIPQRVKIYDAFENENPKRNGFGENEIGGYIKKNPQDIIIIFNDYMITTSLIKTIINECGKFRNKFKIISYMDQVYTYQPKQYIEILNTYTDSIIAFTPYWKEIAYKLGIDKNKNIHVFPHGFDYKLYYPIPQNIARLFYGFDSKTFMVLNLNRNQPRKRWDTTLIAWAEFVERHYNVNVAKKLTKNDCKINKHTSRPIKLVVGTLMLGFWDLMDLFENEIKLRNVPMEYAKETLHFIENPQQLSDRDINILYNACDVGLNTADGEGFGLCGFEGLAIGKPQISSYVGGMRDFLSEEYSLIVKSKSRIYLDNRNAGISGCIEITDPSEYAEHFWRYFSSPELMEKHSKKGREYILTNYKWNNIVDYFYNKIIPVL